MKDKIIYDCEVYRNYLLIMFMNPESGKIRYYEKHNNDDSKTDLSLKALKAIVSNKTLVGFNSINYDDLILSLALSGAKNESLKRLSDQIITTGDPHWLTRRKVDIPNIKMDTIDLKEVAPGVAVSLKIYGGRLAAPKLQDLPIEPSATISASDASELRKYCVNDVETTAMLYKAISKQIKLREQVGAAYCADMRSKSDAQMAEVIIKTYLEKEGVRVGKRQTEVKPFKYRVPDWLEFETPEMKAALERVKSAEFTVSDAGKPEMPKILNEYIHFNGGKYKFGIGGLHSNEKSQVVIPSKGQCFGEFDIASMYPSIILEQELYPLHIGEKFLKVYHTIFDQRLAAKAEMKRLSKESKEDNKEKIAELDVVQGTYKISLNGSYGKFGSPYSFLYSPELLIQTTITGQLFLLMAIEKVTLAGGKVYSANTDGINVLCDEKEFAEVETAILDCELLSGYTFEYTPYLATYSRDVNNYVAIKDDGIKGKGFYGLGGLMKNPQTSICMEAIHNYLKDGIPLDTTIKECSDISKFCVVRTVNGGAVKNGELLGKAIRWYYADGETGTINYKKNGNKVPKSDGAKPLMNLPDTLPTDIDYDYYIEISKSYLADLGVNYA